MSFLYMHSLSIDDQEICIPRTEAAFWKDDRLSTADWDEVIVRLFKRHFTVLA